MDKDDFEVGKHYETINGEKVLVIFIDDDDETIKIFNSETHEVFELHCSINDGTSNISYIEGPWIEKKKGDIHLEISYSKYDVSNVDVWEMNSTFEGELDGNIILHVDENNEDGGTWSYVKDKK